MGSQITVAQRLLDDSLLNGPHEVTIALHPRSVARCVANSTIGFETIGYLCHAWGGAGNPLLPLSGSGIPAYYVDPLLRSEVHGYTAEPPVDLRLPYFESLAVWDYPAALIAAHSPREHLRTLEVIELGENDPWRLAYAGTLGWMPTAVPDELCESASIRHLDVTEVIDVEKRTVVGNLEDLIERVLDPTKITPRQFSTLYLASGRQPNAGLLGGKEILPSPWRVAEQAGPNIVVAMSRGSVTDLALLWYLRATWGDRGALPIGVPAEALDEPALRRLQTPGISQPFGLKGGPLHLVSASLSIKQVEQLASLLPSGVAATPGQLVGPVRAPHRPSSSIAYWSNGRARINPLAPSDHEVLSAASYRPPSLVLSAAVVDSPVPSVGTLRNRLGEGFECGSVQLAASPWRGRRTVDVVWPAPWTVLAAAALERGLEIRESQPGRAAMALFRALGRLDEAYYLSNAKLIALLYRLGERSGMSWWKARWSRVEKQLRRDGMSEDDISRLADSTGRDDPGVAPPNEGRQLPYTDFKGCIGTPSATKAWLEWATDRGVIVKGVELECPSCKVPFWLPTKDMAPPHTCPGCTTTVDHSFSPDIIRFKYRIGEVLRRCLEVDALGHVLALRWLVQLLDDYGLVGAHPGVEFLRDGRVVAEADVVLLFHDGSLVPVEVKRRARAFDDRAAQQLENISALLEAKWDAVCILEPEGECGSVTTYKRALPDRPRFLLTLDHLEIDFPVWSLGSDPFELAGQRRTSSDGHAQWQRDVEMINKMPKDPVAFILDEWAQKEKRPNS
ncbi:MAG: hypothetical protein KIT69_06410 [Propionibacteriaceae bacterium]|nr:hypothetical protein [Actinomycetota bacterium]MCW5951872.1 hypothetical protein [Propionibacteriaceae bacterium]